MLWAGSVDMSSTLSLSLESKEARLQLQRKQLQHFANDVMCMTMT